MAQREWVEKDFYKELGVSSDAAPEEIKRALASCSPRIIPTATRGTSRPRTATRRYPRPKRCSRIQPNARSTTRLVGSLREADSGAAASTRVASAASQGGPHMAPMAPS